MLASDILPPRTVSSRGMLAMLKRLETDSPNQYTFKLQPADSPSFRRGLGGGPSLSLREGDASKRSDARRGCTNADEDFPYLPKSALNSPTGLAFLYTKTPDTTYQPRLAIAPPFPIKSETETTDRETLLQSIDPPLHVAIILIRYGYVAIAIAHDETIIVSKTDTRWVPNKHRAGGQSANRFKRSREKWAREFFDKSARLATERFTTYPHHIDHLIFGGDKHVPQRRGGHNQPIPRSRNTPQQPLRPHPPTPPKHPPPKPQRPKRRRPSNLVIHHLRTRRTTQKSIKSFPIPAHPVNPCKTP